jgi:hypothetical protein
MLFAVELLEGLIINIGSLLLLDNVDLGRGLGARSLRA